MNSGEIKDLNVQRKTQKSTKTKSRNFYLVLGMEKLFDMAYNSDAIQGKDW